MVTMNLLLLMKKLRNFPMILDHHERNSITDASYDTPNLIKAPFLTYVDCWTYFSKKNRLFVPTVLIIMFLHRLLFEMNVTKVISKNVSLKSAENDFIFYLLSSTFCQAGKLEITGCLLQIWKRGSPDSTNFVLPGNPTIEKSY